MRGTVRMTARSVRPSRTGARVMTTHAPIVLVALADARVESFALGASVALVLNAHSRLRWGDGSEGALHRLWADGGGGAVHHGEMGRGYASTGQLSSYRVATAWRLRNWYAQPVWLRHSQRVVVSSGAGSPRLQS